MKDSINLKGLSDDFGDTVLVWKSQVNKLMNTEDFAFSWQIQEGPKVYFTVQSMVQQLYKKNYKERKTTKTGKQFLIVPRAALTEV